MKDENKREREEQEEDERDDKVVNFLGIKQSWWRVTSKIYAAILAGYGGWYVFFDLEHEGSFSEWVQIVGQHMLIASGFLMTAIYAGAHIGDAIMMLHDWYRERRDRRRRETEAKLRDAVEALHVAEEAQREAEEARRAATQESRRAAETVAQLHQNLEAWNAWNYRRLQAAEKGEAFHEPSPNGTDVQNSQ